MGNLTDQYPIHLHGYDFAVTCTDGGWVPESAGRSAIDVPSAACAFEVVADEPGDWAIHCHRSHTMNAMGHDVKTFIGVKSATSPIGSQARADYMPMGSAGMADMGAMEMPMPDNTLPMMTGFGR
jgi:hypothetical protein